MSVNHYSVLVELTVTARSKEEAAGKLRDAFAHGDFPAHQIAFEQDHWFDFGLEPVIRFARPSDV